MLLSNCAICGKKKWTFINNKGLNNVLNDQFEMSKIINQFLLTGEKVMPELHLKQPGFTYSACGPFVKASSKNLKIQRNR